MTRCTKDVLDLVTKQKINNAIMRNKDEIQGVIKCKNIYPKSNPLSYKPWINLFNLLEYYLDVEKNTLEDNKILC